jgi:tetratricopeptide (TPR) repeat protein
LARNGLGAVLEHADRWDEAVTVLDRAVDECRAAGDLRAMLSSLYFAGLARANLGDLGGALRGLEHLWDLLQRHEISANRPRALTGLAWTWWELGERHRAGDLLEQALDVLGEPEVGATHLHERAHTLAGLAETALLDGDAAGAARRLEEIEPLLVHDLPYKWRLGLRLSELQCRLEPGRAEELLGLAVRWGSRKYRALALAHLGRTAEATDEAGLSGSDLLIAQVAARDIARAAVDRMAAKLPAELRETFVARGRVPAALARRGGRPEAG